MIRLILREMRTDAPGVKVGFVSRIVPSRGYFLKDANGKFIFLANAVLKDYIRRAKLPKDFKLELDTQVFVKVFMFMDAQVAKKIESLGD